MKLPVKYTDFHYTKRWKIREAYIEQQKGLCYHCHACLKGSPEESIAKKKVTPKRYPKGFFNHPVHLHHNRVTGMTLGAVHCHCNAVLWEYHNE